MPRLEKTLVILIILIIISESRQNFTYQLSDYIYIPANRSTIAQNTINTRSDQYLSSGQLVLSTYLKQYPVSASYHLLYFNMSNTNNLTCYEKWLDGGLIENSVPCTQIIDTTGYCVNYTGCKDQTIYFQFSLHQQMNHLSSLVYIQNTNSTQGIIIQTQTTLKILASNVWFYVGIALVCVLLLSIVVLTGVAFYWSLKFKKTQKKYEQYKLTGQNDIKNQ